MVQYNIIPSLVNLKMSLALDEQYVSYTDDNGSTERLPALHPKWKDGSRQFISYIPPPLANDSGAAFDAWNERLTFIEEDLNWLLHLNHQLFWCQIVFDESVHKCLTSYLKEAPRSQDGLSIIEGVSKSKHDTIHKLVFLTCVRMSTFKESKTHYLTPSVFGEILYENYIFDIAKLMDMCVLYGEENRALLHKMIGNIFINQTKYNDDLRGLLPSINHVLETIQEQCGLDIGVEFNKPQKLSEAKPSLLTMSDKQFQDIVFYITDTLSTLRSFLDVYPEAGKILQEQELPIKLINAYDSLVGALHDALKKRVWNDSNGLKTFTENRIQHCQKCFLRVFRILVEQSCLQPIYEHTQSQQDVIGSYIEQYLHWMSECLAKHRFLGHYESLYPMREDLELILNTSYPIDETRLAFIEEGVHEAYATFGKRKRGRRKECKKSGAEVFGQPADKQSSHLDDLGEIEGAVGGLDIGAMKPAEASKTKLNQVELDSLIYSVKDLLPDLSEGFIEECLEEFGYDSELVINSLLEDKLPPFLDRLPRDMPRKERVPVPEETISIEDGKELLSIRKSVFDNDEFDVFNRKDVDLSRIHKGKRDTIGKDMSLMDDKSHIADLKPLYDLYGSVSHVDGLYDTNADYEDEYDDTYDDNLVGAEDADSADELTARRPFTIPRILESRQKDKSESEEEAEDDQPRDQFIADPAKIREAQAARYASKQQRHHRRSQGQAPQLKVKDVKGNPKGQGQEKGVIKNRQNKEKHKSSRANHNRRVLADKKRKI